MRTTFCGLADIRESHKSLNPCVDSDVDLRAESILVATIFLGSLKVLTRRK